MYSLIFYECDLHDRTASECGTNSPSESRFLCCSKVASPLCKCGLVRAVQEIRVHSCNSCKKPSSPSRPSRDPAPQPKSRLSCQKAGQKPTEADRKMNSTVELGLGRMAAPEMNNQGAKTQKGFHRGRRRSTALLSEGSAVTDRRYRRSSSSSRPSRDHSPQRKMQAKIIVNISHGEYVKNFTNFSCKGGDNFLGCAAVERQ